MGGISVASMFADIGGKCIGFKAAGAEIVWANELNAPACRTYRYNFGNEYLQESDVRIIDFHNTPEFDILTAGFPIDQKVFDKLLECFACFHYQPSLVFKAFYPDYRIKKPQRGTFPAAFLR